MKRLYIAVLGLSVIFSSGSRAFYSADFLYELASRDVAIIGASAGGCALAGLGIFCYNKAQQAIKDKIIDVTADKIIIGCTLDSDLSEDQLKEKAFIVSMRKRVLKQLLDVLNKDSSLSLEHRSALRKVVMPADIAFKWLDRHNQYKEDDGGVLSASIDKNIVDSIVLRYKPDYECSVKELNEKKQAKKRKALIAEKIQSKTDDVFIKRLLKVALFVDIISMC